MHTEDFDRILLALSTADIITEEQRRKASNSYHAQRITIETEAAERAKRLGLDRERDQPFDKFMEVMMWRVPVVGIPVMFVALIAWLVIASVI